MTEGSFLIVKEEPSRLWSLPLATTRGQTQGRLRDMGKCLARMGVKRSSLGYMDKGERVPEVMTRERYLARTGAMAMEASMQLSWMRESEELEWAERPSSMG